MVGGSSSHCNFERNFIQTLPQQSLSPLLTKSTGSYGLSVLGLMSIPVKLLRHYTPYIFSMQNNAKIQAVENEMNWEECW